jgi:tetrahydromethanopterin S-methyltransferase subunit B
MSNTTEIKIPDIGDFDEVEVIEVLVAEGDQIAEEQSLNPTRPPWKSRPPRREP